ncbi:erythromycin esterase family protein [Hymenobacter sp. UYP22]|uniref:erythromycin esterase family protein n=1 Tax=Hymenobacter sp. UYP22 TaxID=3156348 RepID=UPI0033936671
MRTIPLVLLLLCHCLQLQAQAMTNRLTYMEAQALPVRNVEPTNEDYRDLAPLKQRLQEVTVVGLGEPIHYDGSSFKAKTRLIKFLHQELGFRVIAFESGFYDCYKAWQQIQRGKMAAIAASRKSLYPFWISTETEELFRYIDQQKNTDKPLVLAGIDCKFSGAYSDQQLVPDLQAYLQGVNSPLVQDTARWNAFSGALKRAIHTSDYFSKPSPADTLVLTTGLKDILADRHAGAAGTTRPQEELFWQQFCRSSLAEVTRKFSQTQVRDRQMGENLAALQKELYPGAKIMVWAAASHLTYQGVNIDRKFYHQNLRLGDYIKQGYGKSYYNIGFTGYQGKFGKLLFFHILTLKKHKRNSIEYVLGQTEKPYLFVDLTKPDLPQWLQQPLVSKVFGYKSTLMRLPLVMDGLFFTRDVFQNHWIPPVATPDQKR